MDAMRGSLSRPRLAFFVACAAFLAAAPGAHAKVVTKTFRWGPVDLGPFSVKRDTALPRAPRMNGYIIHRRDKWQMNWMLMNHTARPERAYIRYVVTIDTARERPVKPFWLDVARCHGGG